MKKNKTWKLFDLTGKVALVTGGARGLGYDIAISLAEAGADVAITSRALANAQESARKIQSSSDADTLALQLDHCDWAQVQQVAHTVHQWKNRIDILVNNAGGGGGGASGETNLFERAIEDIDYLIRNNLIAPIYCCKAVGKLMLEQGSGKIINIASIAGLVGRDRRMYDRNDVHEQPVDYAAAKAGLLGLTRDLAALMSPQGVLVNAISPGAFDSGQLPEKFVKDYSDVAMQARMGRIGLDLNGAVVFLASAASDYITGANIVVDGGFSVWK